jgi:hypothetical protein
MPIVDRTNMLTRKPISVPPDVAALLTSDELPVDQAARAYAAANHLTREDVLRLLCMGALRLRFDDDAVVIERVVGN